MSTLVNEVKDVESAITGDGTYGEWLTSFFTRLRSLEPVLRIILHDAPLSADLSFRGTPSRQVLLDFSRHPARIVLDQPGGVGRIRVAVPSAVMHQILLGRLTAGEALGQRQLLLRGAPSDLAHFVPLFDFAPLLYRDHLSDLGVRGFARRRDGAVEREETMKATQSGQERSGPWLWPSGEAALVRMVERAAYAAGYGMAVLRHRYLQKLSMFEVMAAMARGVTAAAPPVEPDRSNGEPHD